MATLSADPVSASLSASRSRIHQRLSTHGMPKQPRSMSSERPHRFSALGFPSPPSSTAPISPKSPSSMSPPPMSARSFGTFIDSEPSTPAYSPRIDHDWDSSTLVLLRPMSSSSEPSSPTEPAWDMMAPIKLPPKSTTKPTAKSTTTRVRAKGPAITAKEISTVTPSAHPVKQTRPIKRPTAIKVVDLAQKEDQIPRKEEIEEGEEKKAQEKDNSNTNNNTSTAPLGKLASKMKLMLRRKNTSDKKKQKKTREYEEVHRLEDVHWSEM